MNCTHCGARNHRSAVVCKKCGRALKAKRVPEKAVEEKEPEKTAAQKAVSIAVKTFFFAVTAVLFGFLFYRAYYWFQDWWLARSYSSGRLKEPLVEEMTMDDGQQGHAITFFGNDGDQLFVAELGRSYLFAGGMTRIEVPDSNWFDEHPEDVESAYVTLTPIVRTSGGAEVEIPVMELDIDAPDSPLTLVDPASDWSQVVTSIYPLSVRVVPGSEVLIGGEDVTDTVDFQGNLTVNINVYPQGDNQVSILVSTPHHRQTRRDLILYREYQEINLEPSLNLVKRTNKDTMTVTGTVDPEAVFSVDTDYVPGSVSVDATGKFKFTAKLKEIGDNTITFRASQAGKQDSVVSISCYYVPPYNTYVNKAWAMDYQQLSLYYETWIGRIFLCRGPVVDIRTVDGNQQLVMNVGSETEPNYVILDNYSTITEPVIGQEYRAYSDVLGNLYYDETASYCPHLAARYMVAVEEN